MVAVFIVLVPSDGGEGSGAEQDREVFRKVEGGIGFHGGARGFDQSVAVCQMPEEGHAGRRKRHDRDGHSGADHERVLPRQSGTGAIRVSPAFIAQMVTAG